MALPTIDISNFKGWLKISANSFKESLINDYISLFYEEYLRDILGDAAYIDIVATTKTKWTDLLNGVNYTNLDGNNRINDGVLDQIVKFIYFQFISDNFVSSQVGKVNPVNENATNLTGVEQGILAIPRYNSGIKALKESVCEFLDTYEEISETITGFTDNADNTYLINVALTKYLDDGDTVEIGGVEYVISGLIANTSFVIDAGQVGLSFSGQVVWKPYEDVEFNSLEYMTI